jgi:hypothetical protein
MNVLNDARKSCVGSQVINGRPYVIAGKDDVGKDLCLIADDCPFCGGTPEWQDDGNETVWIACDNCKVRTYSANEYSVDDCEGIVSDWNSYADFDGVKRKGYK